MSRSFNRHTAVLARVRKHRILTFHWWRYFPDKPWQDYRRLCMNEPGWWTREFVTRPARVRSRHLCRLIELGTMNPEGIIWPDYRRPHVYYW